MKCDYCEAEVDISKTNTIPQGWLSCRIKKTVTPKIHSTLGVVETVYVQGPTVCPEHRRQLHNIFQ